MEVLGRQNVPQNGPVIFTGNHMNQFVDAAVVLISTPRKVKFLVAEKSYHKPIIGHFGRAVGSIPVARPQDSAAKGPGEVMFEGLTLRGKGTRFTKLNKGDRIRPGRSAEGFRLRQVVSDEEAWLVEELGEASPHEEPQGVWMSYDILGFIDQSKMFDKVHEALASGHCLCIFPEGGSHDRTDLLPLKVGIASIAVGVLEKYGINVPIIPVGLTYFRGHRFRGRVVAEFGAPIRIDEIGIDIDIGIDNDTAIEEKLKEGHKREAYQMLLKRVANGMRSTLVTAANYGELKLVHTFRRLFQNPATTFTTQQKQDLSRRLSMAYRVFSDRCRSLTSRGEGEGDSVDVTAASTYVSLSKEQADELLAEMASLRRRLESYQSTLEYWGLRDYQVPALDLPAGKMEYWRLLYIFVHATVVCLLASIPTIILNAPVGMAARMWALREAKKDLQASRVKLAARDVLLSKKIMFSLVAVPVLWVSYAVLLLLFTPLQLQTVLFMFLCCPVFSYLGVRAVEAGMVDMKDLRPAFLRLSPHFANQRALLPQVRANLQKDVRVFVRKYGPSLGALYADKEIGSATWEAISKQVQLSEERRGLEGDMFTSEVQGLGSRSGLGAGSGSKVPHAQSQLEDDTALLRSRPSLVMDNGDDDDDNSFSAEPQGLEPDGDGDGDGDNNNDGDVVMCDDGFVSVPSRDEEDRHKTAIALATATTVTSVPSSVKKDV
eukprot:gene8454-17430_t